MARQGAPLHAFELSDGTSIIFVNLRASPIPVRAAAKPGGNWLVRRRMLERRLDATGKGGEERRHRVSSFDGG